MNFPLDSGILTNLLNTFVVAFSGGYANIYPDAMRLLAILATLEITIAALWWSITEDNALIGLLRKCIHIGFFIFVVTQYQWLIKMVLSGFIFTGLKAGGSNNMDLLTDPSLIIDFGFAAVAPIFDHINSYTPVAQLAHLPSILFSWISATLIVVAYFAIAIQVFVTYLEFYLMSVLGLILIPFGVLKHTSFLAEKVFGGIIAFGVRLMVLAFIVAVSLPILQSVVLPAQPTWNEIFVALLAALAILGLSWHAPAVASGLISGSPSLTAGAAVGMGAAAVAGAAGAGFAATAAAKGVASAGVSATKAAASTAGAVSTAGGLGAAAAGGGVMSQAVGAVKGVGAMAAGGMKSSINSAMNTISEANTSGKLSAFSATGGQVIGADRQPKNPGNTGPGGTSAAMRPFGSGKANQPGTSSPSKATMPTWARNIQQARSAIPQEASPEAGMHVPIRHE